MTDKPTFQCGTPERKVIYAYEGALEEAVAAERERCAKICDDWLARFKNLNPKYDVSAKKCATDAVLDIADAIRKPELI